MAEIEPRRCTARDGQTFVVRVATDDDAAGVLRVARESIAEGPWSVTRPSEFQFTEEQERDYLRGHREHPRQIALVADGGAGAVGFLGVEGGTRLATQHVGTLHLVVDRNWRGRSVGRAMMRAAMDWIAGHADMSKLELAVLADNERAIALYRKLGFREEGRRRDAVRREDGSLVDDVLMAWFPGDAATRQETA